MILKSIIEFYKVSKPKPCGDGWTPESERRLKHLQWSTFLSATLGYGMYYVCRLSLNVVNPLWKKVSSRKPNWASSDRCCSSPMQ